MQAILSLYSNIEVMRHRIKAGKVCSFTPEKQKVEIEQLGDREVAEEVKKWNKLQYRDEKEKTYFCYDNPNADILCMWEQITTG